MNIRTPGAFLHRLLTTFLNLAPLVHHTSPFLSSLFPLLAFPSMPGHPALPFCILALPSPSPTFPLIREGERLEGESALQGPRQSEESASPVRFPKSYGIVFIQQPLPYDFRSRKDYLFKQKQPLPYDIGKRPRYI